jgi:hypothetical protein
VELTPVPVSSRNVSALANAPSASNIIKRTKNIPSLIVKDLGKKRKQRTLPSHQGKNNNIVEL